MIHFSVAKQYSLERVLACKLYLVRELRGITPLKEKKKKEEIHTCVYFSYLFGTRSRGVGYGEKFFRREREREITSFLHLCVLP